MGFDSVRSACFVPRSWISISLLEPEESADLYIWHRAVFRGLNCKLRQQTRDSIGWIWSQHLWAELAKRGFAKVDPHLLPWRRTRSVAQHNANRKWKELNRMMWEQGVSSWAKIEAEPEPEPRCPGAWVD